MWFVPVAAFLMLKILFITGSVVIAASLFFTAYEWWLRDFMIHNGMISTKKAEDLTWLRDQEDRELADLWRKEHGKPIRG